MLLSGHVPLLQEAAEGGRPLRMWAKSLKPAPGDFKGDPPMRGPGDAKIDANGFI